METQFATDHEMWPTQYKPMVLLVTNCFLFELKTKRNDIWEDPNP